MNVVLETSIKGTINLRLENKTPREVIEIIGQANRLVIDELNGVYYIKSWDQPFKQQAEWIAHSTKLMVDAYMEKGFTRAEAMDLIRNLPGGIQLEPRPKAPEMHTKRATR